MALSVIIGSPTLFFVNNGNTQSETVKHRASRQVRLKAEATKGVRTPPLFAIHSELGLENPEPTHSL